MAQIPMGDVFETMKPESYYEGELAKLSGEVMKSDHIIEKLTEALKSIKRDINNVQSFEPDDYGLNKVTELINKTLNKYGGN